MPPVRTAQPLKSGKAERTHEENQERAYIAASRRNDRSLEARVESARRASEIHKRRTGRALRVTEKDVLNEEMYEEEDDELPTWFRGIPPHIARSSDWARRFDAYFTGQVAMRNYLRQAVQSQYVASAHDPLAPAATYNPYFQQPALSVPHHISTNRQQPYPTPGSQRLGRIVSVNPPPRPSIEPELGQIQSDMAYADLSSDMGRRISLTGNNVSSPCTISPPNTLSPQVPDHAASPIQHLNNVQLASPKHDSPALPIGNPVPQYPYVRHSLIATGPTHYGNFLDYGPFTTTLPPETQTFLAPSLNRSTYNSFFSGGAGSPYLFDNEAPLKPVNQIPAGTSFDAGAVDGGPLYTDGVGDVENFDASYHVSGGSTTAMTSLPIKTLPAPRLGSAESSGSENPLDDIWQTFMNHEPN